MRKPLLLTRMVAVDLTEQDNSDNFTFMAACKRHRTVEAVILKAIREQGVNLNVAHKVQFLLVKVMEMRMAQHWHELPDLHLGRGLDLAAHFPNVQEVRLVFAYSEWDPEVNFDIMSDFRREHMDNLIISTLLTTKLWQMHVADAMEEGQRRFKCA